MDDKGDVKHGTAIGWTHGDGFKGETWNPCTGCSKVSPGCARCYAETLTARYAGRPGFIAEHRPWTPANAAHNVKLWPERLRQPLRWRKPRMVFVNSMSDLFHEEIPDSFIAEVFAVMAVSPRHTFQILTKRPERMLALLNEDRSSRIFWQHVLGAVQRLCGEKELLWPCELDGGGLPQVVRPLPNVWLGVSVENHRYVERADLLRETPAAVRFISAEPLLGPLMYSHGQKGPLDLAGIDWLIVGGESGAGHRPVDLQWVRDLRDAILGHAFDWEQPPGTLRRPAFFFKQVGGATPKSGGRELDGQTWDEMPR